MALLLIFRHAPRDVLDALGVAHRGAAVFLNDERHAKSFPFSSPGWPVNFHLFADQRHEPAVNLRVPGQRGLFSGHGVLDD